ncbi:MAG: TetR/AcrR family transcriptional regulator, partial [Sphingobacteriales bacterium]
ASKSIVFSFAFTSVSDSDVRKNFVSFQKEILPFLVKAAL